MRKRGLALLLALVLGVGLAGCGKEKAEIAFVLHSQDDFENDFLGSAWDGVQQFGADNSISVKAYEPVHRTGEEQMKTLEQALDGGAETVVFPSYLLGKTAFVAQEEYPDIRFILIDSVPNNANDADYREKVAGNTCALLFNEGEAGFLAGYAAVMDGFTKLGFFGGMAIPPVLRYGYGYVQGAEYAARQLGLPPGSVEMRYLYCGTFTAAPEYQAKAASWYWEGTEVIFACGGAMGQSVVQASTSAEDAWVIGVDVDQSGDAETVLTSAVKEVTPSVYGILQSLYAGEFPGGQALVVGAADGGIGLEMQNARFRRFTMAEYEEIFSALVQDRDGIASGLPDHTVELEDIPLSCVALRLESIR